MNRLQPLLACSLALIAVLCGAIGCAGGSSSDKAQGGADRVATNSGSMTGAATGDGEPQLSRRRDRAAEDSVPKGTRKDTKVPRVQRAIADLLHPGDGGQGRGRSRDDHPRKSREGGHDGALDKVLRFLHSQAHRLDPLQHPSHGGDEGLNILELLK